MNRKLALGLVPPAELDAHPKTATFDCVDRFRPARNRSRACAALAATGVPDAHRRGRGSAPDSRERDPACRSLSSIPTASTWWSIGTGRISARRMSWRPCRCSIRSTPGHDNNRDWFMMNLPETRNVARLLFREWFPQIVYNQHQAPPFPARIFVPPVRRAAEPEHSGARDGRNQRRSDRPSRSAWRERTSRACFRTTVSTHGGTAVCDRLRPSTTCTEF